MSRAEADLNSAKVWDETYSGDRAAGKRRIDQPRLEFLVGEMRDWWQYHMDIDAPTLLDLGCGDGEMLRRVHAELPSWRKAGIDIAAKTLEVARGENPGFTFEVRSIYDIGAQSADVAWCGETLEHLDRPEMAIESMVASLRPGGYLVCSVPNERMNPSPDHVREFSVSDAIKLTEGCGDLLRVRVVGNAGWASIVWSARKR